MGTTYTGRQEGSTAANADHLHRLADHVHGIGRVYPTLAAGVVVTGAAGAWTLGNAATIVAGSTITDPYDIHWINIEAISAVDVYELVLYADAVECARVRFAKTATLEGTQNVFCMTPVLAANAALTAKVANGGGGTESCTISVSYHTY
jgi:hypothetical protein